MISSSLHFRPRTRAITVVFVVLSVAVFAAACGSSSSSDNTPKGGRYSETAAHATARKAKLMTALGSDGAALVDAGCTISTPRMIVAKHEDGITPDEWNTNPPSSGPHNQNWASWGRFDDVLPDANALHNLEHGGVAIWFGPAVPTSAVDLIDSKLLKKGTKIILVPRAKLDGGIVSSSWGTRLECPAAAITKLGDAALVTGLGTWYTHTNSTQTPQEKSLPAYEGTLTSPKPAHDISLPRPSFG